MSTRRVLIEVGVVVGGLVLVVALAVWTAGRAAGLLAGSIPVEVDRALGKSAWEAMAQSEQCKNPEPSEYVENIARVLLDAAGQTPYDFQFVVVSDPAINAFALPGGYVTVNMGLLESAETGSEVAAVLAHEMQHVLLRHGTKRILRQLGGATVLYALFGGTDIAVPAVLIGDFLNTAYDRGQEREADERALELLARAGIDPRGMARFFERLAESAVTPPELVSTHPDPGNRAEAAARAAETTKAVRELPKPEGLGCATTAGGGP